MSNFSLTKCSRGSTNPFNGYITKKNQYYLQIFTHGSESVDKFSIIYGYYLRTTLPTDIIHRF